MSLINNIYQKEIAKPLSYILTFATANGLFAGTQERLTPLKVTGATEQTRSVNLTGTGNLVSDFYTILDETEISNMGTNKENPAYFRLISQRNIPSTKTSISNHYETQNPALKSGNVMQQVINEMNPTQEQISLIQSFLHNPDSLVKKVLLDSKEVDSIYESMRNNKQKALSLPVIYGAGNQACLDVLRFDLKPRNEWLKKKLGTLKKDEATIARVDSLYNLLHNDLPGILEDYHQQGYRAGFSDAVDELPVAEEAPVIVEKKKSSFLTKAGIIGALGTAVYFGVKCFFLDKSKDTTSNGTITPVGDNIGGN